MTRTGKPFVPPLPLEAMPERMSDAIGVSGEPTQPIHRRTSYEIHQEAQTGQRLLGMAGKILQWAAVTAVAGLALYGGWRFLEDVVWPWLGGGR